MTVAHKPLQLTDCGVYSFDGKSLTVAAVLVIVAIHITHLVNAKEEELK